MLRQIIGVFFARIGVFEGADVDSIHSRFATADVVAQAVMVSRRIVRHRFVSL